MIQHVHRRSQDIVAAFNSKSPVLFVHAAQLIVAAWCDLLLIDSFKTTRSRSVKDEWRDFARFHQLSELQSIAPHFLVIFSTGRRLSQRRKKLHYTLWAMKICHFHSFIGPETGLQALRPLLQFFLLLVLRLLSFHNRSSSNFANRLKTTLSTIAQCRIFNLIPNYSS